MKRYFTFQTPPDPAKYSPRGGYHYLNLPGSGCVCVLQEESSPVPADWVELPHLLDATAANFNGINTTAGAYVHPLTAQTPAPSPIAGVTPADTTFQAMKKISAINPHFYP